MGASAEAEPLLATPFLGVDDVARLRHVLLAFSMILSFCLALFFSIRTEYTEHCLHSSEAATTGTLAVIAYYLCHAVSNPILGKLSDSVGRKPLLLAGIAAIVTVFGLFAVISDPLTFILLFAALGVVDSSNVMYHLMIVDTASVDLRAGGGLFAFFASRAQVDGVLAAPPKGGAAVDEPIQQRRVAVLFSAIYVASLLAAGLGFGAAVLLEGGIGVRGTVAVAAASILPLFFFVAYALPETARLAEPSGADSCSGAVSAVLAEQAAGLALLTETPRRRLLLFATFCQHGAAAGASALMIYWAVYKFGFGMPAQTAVLLVGLWAIGLGVALLQGVFIPVFGLDGPRACVAVIGVSACCAAFLALAFEPWMVFVGVMSVLGAAINPEVRSQITADVALADQGFVQGAIQTVNSVGDSLGAFVLLVTFEDTTDDDVAHDTHRGRHSIRANLIWHVILGLSFCAVCALLLVKETPPRPQTARPML